MLKDAPHTFVALQCYQMYLVLPYYSLIPAKSKSRVNGYFWRGMRKKFGPLAYLHTLEQQRGLLHGNWFLLSDKRVEPAYVLDRWKKALKRYTNENFRESEGECSPVKSQDAAERLARYIVKAFEKDPTSHLPPKGRYSRVMYTSPSYKEYVKARDGEKLLAEILAGDG